MILNDPIYGSILVAHPLIQRVLDHRWFQRLRHIKQLGLSHLVYPGATHTRFHHALGAMHLMGEALDVLRSKGHAISEEEGLGARIAVLLHDIGHGPFSHTLEHSLVEGTGHEDLGALVMDALNEEFNGELSLGIRIFRDQYPKRALHQLVSSQLDVDRMDYLNRDSFYTGVSEGVIGGDRMIKMLEIVDDRLVVEEKAIYSVEKFIVARRLMYWQVYLHKTVVAAELMLIEILRRARELASEREELFCGPPLHRFLYTSHDHNSFITDRAALEDFLKLDDHDIMGAVKVWTGHADPVLSGLCSDLVQRRLFRIKLANTPWAKDKLVALREEVVRVKNLTNADVDRLVLTGSIMNNAYDQEQDMIELLAKDGTLRDIADASDTLGIQALAHTVEKHYLAYPRWLGKEWLG